MKKSTKRFVLSDETKNSYGFVTLTDGIDLSDFEANPVMLYDHDYSKVIGQWADLQKEGKQLTAVPLFDEDDADAMKQYSKVEQGILKGASVGIAPLKYDATAGIMHQSTLKEASLTPVPSNSKALQIALYDTGGIKLNGNQASRFLLSLNVDTTNIPELTQNKNMTPKMITALVALCLQAGHTINLSAQPDDDEIEGALDRVKQTLTTLSAENLTFKNELKQAKAAAITDEVAAAITDKRLSADLNDNMVAFGEQHGIVALKALLGGIKPVSVATIPSIASKDKNANVPAEKLAWTYDDYAEKAPRELEVMEVKNPELFTKLTTDKITALRNKHAIEA